DRDWRVRRAACEALGRIGDARAVEPLIKKLEDKDPSVRTAVCQALGRIGHRSAVRPLIQVLWEPDEDLHRMVCDALRQLGEAEFAGAFAGALEADYEALNKLGQMAAMGDLRAVAPLRRLFRGADRELSRVARGALDVIWAAIRPKLGSFLCPSHLARFQDRPVEESNPYGPVYGGCRICGNSDPVWKASHVVAVLDTDWQEELQPQDDLLRVNWLLRRELFDFDSVEILQATDEDVERFAVQVQNDTDPFRTKRYKQMRCVVSQQAGLSENTMRILKSTFGEVTVE
ncbi:MAG: HEAT repeat domain-containing protein, partial [Verrucomicrobiae bacterium]|nr:HEAT repeat domain-containing protein [Verrucomicrobiae bacterium]